MSLQDTFATKSGVMKAKNRIKMVEQGKAGLWRLGNTANTIYTNSAAGVGTATPTGKLDVVADAGAMTGLDIYAGSMTMKIGAVDSTGVRTDATAKTARIGIAHYTNIEEPVTLLFGAAGAATNNLHIGGGSGTMNAATHIKLYTAANTTTTDGTLRMQINNDGNVFINDTANGDTTLGLTIQQGAADDQILALKSSDVDHGITTIAETDTYGRFLKRSATGGGLLMGGISDAGTVEGLTLNGTIGSADPTDTVAAVLIRGYKSNGTTGVAALGADETVLQFGNSTTAIATFLGSGNFGIGTVAPGAKLAVETGATFGGEAVEIEQGDADQAFVNFEGTLSANATTNLSSWTTASAMGFVKVEINGVARWMPYYDPPTS